MKRRCDRDIEVKVIDTIERIDRDWLDGLADDFCYTYDWFKIIEESRAGFKIEPRYLVVYEEGKSMGFMPALFTYDYPYFSIENRNPIIKTLVNLGNRMGFHLNRGRTLVCDSLNCIRCRILLQKNCDAKAVYDLMFEKIDDICRKEKIPVSCFDVVSDFDEILEDNLQDHGYFGRLAKNCLYLDIIWSRFDEYLDSLESKARKNVRREIKKCKQSGVSIEEEKAFEKHATTLFNLYLNTYLKYNKVKSSLDDSYFTNLGKYARNDATVFTAKKNGKIVGFSLCFQNRDILDVNVAGFDYDSLTKTDFTYFNVAYYTPIRWAIEKGIRRVYFRFGQEEIKSKRGCKIETQTNFIKFHNKLLRPLIKLYVKRTLD